MLALQHAPTCLKTVLNHRSTEASHNIISSVQLSCKTAISALRPTLNVASIDHMHILDHDEPAVLVRL